MTQIQLTPIIAFLAVLISLPKAITDATRDRLTLGICIGIVSAMFLLMFMAVAYLLFLLM